MREFAAEPPIEHRVSEVLEDAGQTIAVAESCTGGLVGSLLTDVPGSSAYFDRSIATYSNDAKMELLCVNREVLDEYGAVSQPVARQMARGIRDSAGTTWGLATTGVAGPDGGTDEKPVGTAYVSVAFADEWESQGSFATVERYVFDGDRLEIKEQVARQAIADLFDAIEERTG